MLLKRYFGSALLFGAGTAALSVCVAFAPVFAQEVTAKCESYDEIKVQEYAGSIQNIVPWAALESGIFKKHCLNARMVQIPSAPAAFAASIQGGVDFIDTAPDTFFIPASKGLDVKIVAFMNDTPNVALVIGKHVPLPHKGEGYPGIMKDLVGKKIGVNALGSATDLFARMNFTTAGLNPASANWVAFGPISAGIAALQNETIDAAQFFSDGMDMAEVAAGGLIVGDLRDPKTKTLPEIAALRGSQLMWASTSDFIKKNPDVVRRFRNANNEAIAWVKAAENRAVITKIVSERAPNPNGITNSDALLARRIDNYLPQLNAKASRRALESWISWSLELKRLAKPVKLDDFIAEGVKEQLSP